MDKVLKHKEILSILLISVTSILIVGLTSEVYLGDESHHYRFAQNIYNTGKRVPFDPLYVSGNPPGFYNNDPPLWHIGLAFLWKITGWVSQAIAQIYHVLFFILLVWCTSLLAKEITGGESRWFPALVMATVPMVVSFSTLFYMDVPMTALSTLGFYLIVRKRYIEAGIISGLMYFTKLNAVFLFPGFLFAVFWNERKKFRGFLKSAIFFLLPILMIYLPDLYWRKTNITNQMDVTAWNYVSYRLSMHFSGAKWKEYLNSYLTNPIDMVKYFGLVFLFLMLVYLFRFRNWDRKGSILLAPVTSYLIFFLMIFGMSSDIRYLMPVIPFFCVLFSSLKIIEHLKWFKVLISMVCLVQLFGTCFYIHQRRYVPLGLKEGFIFIKQNTPLKALFMYPGHIFIEATGRKFIWSSFFHVEYWMMKKNFPELDFMKDKSGFMFWKENEEDIKRMMDFNRLDYIVVDKSRIYDDTEVKHFGGYPESFVERLPTLPFVKNIFENQTMSIWEVKREKPEDYFPMRKEEE